MQGKRNTDEEKLAAEAIIRAIGPEKVRLYEMLFEKFKHHVKGFVSSILVAAVSVFIVRVLLAWLVQLHWSLAILAMLYAIIIAIFIAIMTRAMVRDENPYIVFAFFLQGLIASITACASMSYILNLRGLAIYTTHTDFSFGSFIDYYGWILLDLVPGLKIWETLKISAPFTAANTIAGIPILTFRILVLLGLILSLKRWWKYHESSDK